MSASCPHLATMKVSRRELAALLPALMTSAALGQSSGSQTEASRDDIRKHIDRQWFLNSLLHDNLEHWLTAAATPSGFFQANLDRQWRPTGDAREATLLTQGRLLYNMAVGYEYSRDDRFLNALNKGAEFLISKMH